MTDDTETFDERVIDVLPDDIDRSIEAGYRARFWLRLRPSELGSDCERYLFLQFRWAARPHTPPGRIIRIFERGEREEKEILSDIGGIGIHVADRGHDGRQWQIVAARGHMFGRVDAAVLDQSMKYLSSSTSWAVLEAKSHKAEKWRAIKKHGLAKAEPKHNVQIRVYMHLMSAELGLYFARNKDTEEDHTVEVKADKDFAERMLAKAERIVFSPQSPVKISTDPTFYMCRMCPVAKVCHGVELPIRNCRTCEYVRPVDNGVWVCDLHKNELSPAQQEAGCPSHRWLPTLISGRRQTQREDAVQVYDLVDGTRLVDAGPVLQGA
jgi:hypothetical protein